MSDDQDLESTEDEKQGEDSKRPSYEDLERELRLTRKEAAARRVASREKDSELEEFRQWKESQKSEVEKLSERAEEAERELSAMKYQKLQFDIAQKAGLDLDLADRIRGESEDEMLKDAKLLAERAGKRQNSDLDPFAGRRGGPVRGSKEKASSSDLFRDWLTNQP